MTGGSSGQWKGLCAEGMSLVSERISESRRSMSEISRRRSFSTREKCLDCCNMSNVIMPQQSDLRAYQKRNGFVRAFLVEGKDGRYKV